MAPNSARLLISGTPQLASTSSAVVETTSSTRIFNRQPALTTQTSIPTKTNLLLPNGGILNNISVPVIQQTAGLKHVGVPKRRCKHCYFIVKDEVRYVMCTVHPRHKVAERQVATKFGNMILTHGTQGGRNMNNPRGTRQMKTQQSFRMDF